MDTCPQCGLPLPEDPPSLCPRCHYPLLLVSEEQAGHATAGPALRRPSASEQDDATQLNPQIVAPNHPTAPPPEPSRPPSPSSRGSAAGRVSPPVVVRGSSWHPRPGADGAACPVCGFANPPARVRCMRCGSMMRAVEPPAPPPPPPAPQRRNRTSLVVLVVVLCLVLVAGLGVGAYYVLTQRGWIGETPPAGPPSTVASSPQARELVEVDRAVIDPGSNSVHGQDGAQADYHSERTLDGDVKTAWVSDGAKDGTTGIKIVYAFSEPVEIAQIDIYNGFQRDDGIFERNCRVRLLSLHSDTVTHQVELDDAMGRQRITHDFGSTREVTLLIDSVYQGTHYDDIALAEVVFYRVAD